MPLMNQQIAVRWYLTILIGKQGKYSKSRVLFSFSRETNFSIFKLESIQVSNLNISK